MIINFGMADDNLIEMEVAKLSGWVAVQEYTYALTNHKRVVGMPPGSDAITQVPEWTKDIAAAFELIKGQYLELLINDEGEGIATRIDYELGEWHYDDPAKPARAITCAWLKRRYKAQD